MRTAASCTYDSFFSFVDSGFTKPSRPDFTAAWTIAGISNTCVKKDFVLYFVSIEIMIYPISFCIPECKIIKQLDRKERTFAFIIPGDGRTYIYGNEKDYYEGYAKSIFGVTKKKSGWDCMRHYEILANGCIPWFENLEACPPQTMTHLPKQLILDTMKEANENRLTMDRALEISQTLLDYTRTHLTTKAMASYVLKTSGNENAKSVLYISQDPNPDYLRELLLHGFKELFGSECHENPRMPFLYTDYPESEISKLYGRGMSYTRLMDPSLYNSSKDETLIQDIENHVYDCIVYGSVHRGMPFWNKVVKAYKSSEIILLCGEDDHECKYKHFFGDDGKEFSLFTREI